MNKTIGQKLWDILFQRSPYNASKPVVNYTPFDDGLNHGESLEKQPIETSLEIDSIINSPIRIGNMDTAFKDSDGQLVRVRNTSYLVLGCGHLVAQFEPIHNEEKPVRGIAGPCFYCEEELEPQKITPYDSDRSSLVCSECARISIGGRLCCPRHYTLIPTPEGKEICMGKEEMEEEERKQQIQKILNPILNLFMEDEPPQQLIMPEEDQNQSKHE